MKYQIAIIGGGPAGYTAAETAGKAGLSVVLFEKQSLGGVCLNEGCIPTKTLLYSAKTYDSARHASKYAVSVPEVSFDLSKIVARKQKVVRKLVLGVKGKLVANNVTVVNGEASIADKNHVLCGGETYECDNLLLCTGAETFIPPIPGVGAAITVVPMLVAVVVGRLVFKISLLDLLGTITGGMTSTPGLAAADSMVDSNIPSVAYATVYPIAMVFLILFIQVIASAVY